jgi:hypothetical protein
MTPRDLNVLHTEWWCRVRYNDSAMPELQPAPMTTMREAPGACRVTSVINAPATGRSESWRTVRQK